MKTKSILSYCPGSNTIRQFPENYIIARMDLTNTYWKCEPDMSADKDLSIKVFLELFNFESKYEKDGLKLLAKVTPNK